MPLVIDDITVEDLLELNALCFTPTTTVTTTNGTLILNASSDALQYLTGTATGFKVQLPSALTLQNGHHFVVVNTTSQTVNILDGAGNTLFTVSQNSIAYFYLQINATIAGSWVYYQILASSTASGIINYTLTSTTPFSTSSTTDVAITGFSITPQAGTYAIWYNASVFHTTTPIAHYWSIYKAGTQIADSLRQQDTAHSNQTMVDSTMTTIQVNGSEVIDVRVRRGTSGTLTVNARTLILVRLGT